jgi:hypothetical protein
MVRSPAQRTSRQCAENKSQLNWQSLHNELFASCLFLLAGCSPALFLPSCSSLFVSHTRYKLIIIDSMHTLIISIMFHLSATCDDDVDVCLDKHATPIRT